jgi:NAD(P)-dependent dehydrogenase (short-subunit alcohol dehydrogenase family)
MSAAARRVVITGGARGIGRAMAESYLADGVRVAICDRDAAAVEAFQAAYPAALGEAVDVADEAAMEAFLARVEAEWGGADTVCANAGTGGPAGPLETLDFAAWSACIAVNLHGAFLTCRWAARVMRRRGAGLVVLTASTAGLHGYPNRAPYAAAKWGIVGLTKTLAMELGPAGIRVNALAPGAVAGERMERVLAAEAAATGRSAEALREAYARGTSLRGWVEPADVVAALRFLDSPAGRRISGQVLAIDGHTETLAP